MGKEPAPQPPRTAPAWCLAVVAASAIVGLALMADQAYQMSATYDEVTYLRVAARWWRTGEQESISRMGSPLTFWKIQQAPTLWALDLAGHRDWVNDPIAHQAKLLPLIRIGGLWIWIVALGFTAAWARRFHGPRAMAMASALFALSPNLLAHGALATMELPLVAGTTAMYYGFWRFLRTGNPRYFWATAALGGLVLSCKFTTILVPPILGVAWAVDLWMGRGGTPDPDDRPVPILRLASIARTVVSRMLAFGVVMISSNLILTGFAMIPLSANGGTHPILAGRFSPGVEQWANRVVESPFPQDWVGLATQLVHQRNGGPSYLHGERRLSGWRHYYLVTLAVKVPLAFWFLAAGRAWQSRGEGHERSDRDWTLLVIVVAFLLAAIFGSRRNYGVRYLLPIATPAIVWTSALAEGRRWSKVVAGLGLAGMAVAVAAIHPHELSYFNVLAGGPIGGRQILSDSNLDWGQGARALARLQRDRPELRDLTLYYFGDTDPAYYGVVGHRIIFDANRTPTNLPPTLGATTRFLAVSASLEWGPWGPPGYFRKLEAIPPDCYTDDTTIAIYRTSDLEASGEY